MYEAAFAQDSTRHPTPTGSIVEQEDESGSVTSSSCASNSSSDEDADLDMIDECTRLAEDKAMQARLKVNDRSVAMSGTSARHIAPIGDKGSDLPGEGTRSSASKDLEGGSRDESGGSEDPDEFDYVEIPDSIRSLRRPFHSRASRAEKDKYNAEVQETRRQSRSRRAASQKARGLSRQSKSLVRNNAPKDHSTMTPYQAEKDLVRKQRRRAKEKILRKTEPEKSHASKKKAVKKLRKEYKKAKQSKAMKEPALASSQ
ncbi:MAG: hypothetical protein Q9208_002433 [Pyrenodesmia sp. 3 TL-2023]